MVTIPLKVKIRRGNSANTKHPNYVITVPAAFVHSGALAVGEEYELLIQSKKETIFQERTDLPQDARKGSAVVQGALKEENALTGKETGFYAISGIDAGWSPWITG